MTRDPNASGAVTAVAVVNFLWGAVNVLEGGCCGGVAVLMGVGMAVFFTPLFGLLALGYLALGGLLIAAGWGLLARRPWGRTMTLWLAAANAVLAVVLFGLVLWSLITTAQRQELDRAGTIVLVLFVLAHFVYSAIPPVVLLQERHAAEFAPPPLPSGDERWA
jgi:hypothetical protein